MNIVKNEYFIKTNLERYMKYELDNVVPRVNSNLDRPYYSEIKQADINKGKLVLVNKYYYLEKDFNGFDLVNVEPNYGVGSLNSETYEAFKKLSDAARNEGLYILSRSPYRSYSTQYNTYNGYLNQNGFEWTEKWSARPGHSEHQTGLALDVRSNNSNSLGDFLYTNEYKWMCNNAHLFGFILRYNENNKDFTGYDFEPWHYRYVGVDVAKIIYDKNISFEEYYAYYIEAKNMN